MKNYDPNIRLGTHTIKVSFQRWDYKGFVTFRRGGNCKGLDVLALNEDDLYDQTLTDNPIGFGLLPEDDEGNVYEDYSNEPIEIKANIYPASGKLQVEIYGERLNYIFNMLYDGPENLNEGDGICVFVDKDSKPDYKIISIKPYSHQLIELEKI